MSFVEDFAPFFEESEFADAAIFNLPFNFQRTVSVIFNAPTQEATLYDTSIETDAPFLMVKTDDLIGVKNHSQVSVKNKTYSICKISHDGTGISNVYLKS